MNNRNIRNPDPKFSINSGKVWFGNSFFKFEKTLKNDKKDNLIKSFFETIFNDISIKINNYHLLIQKLIPVLSFKIRDNTKNEEKSLFDLNKECIGGESKKFILEKFVDNFKINNSEFFKNTTNTIKDNFLGFQSIYTNSIVTDTSLICGLGAAHVLETALTLHHIWGVPYIPGSSLKGVCRQVAFWNLVEERGIPENKLEDFQKKFYGELNLDVNNEDMLVYQLLFGAQDFKGLLLFLDAYPEFNNNNKSKNDNESNNIFKPIPPSERTATSVDDNESNNIFKLDIMNPHYSKYYGDSTGRTPPGDWENPTPIFFLTVKEGVKFRFVVLFDEWRWEKIKNGGIYITKDKKKYLIVNKENTENKKDIENDNEKILKVNLPVKQFENILENEGFFNNILKQALSFYGVGSKTRLGYGSFKV